MMLKFCLCIPAILIGTLVTYGQAVDNTASVHMPASRKYIRLHYENDFFTSHDLYYTQGINLESVNPRYATFFINRIFYKPANAISNFGIALEHNGYTPSSITHPEALIGDRPFAADIFLKFFSFSLDPLRHLRITSSFSAGVIGPAAGGEQMQRTIHRWLNTTKPVGWSNQIRNDVIVNYEIAGEKNLFHHKNAVLINALGSVRAGTLNDKLTLGLVMMTGRLNPAIRSFFSTRDGHPIRDFHFHVYFQPLINLVGYDATMQGGVFNRSTPYVIAASHVERITLQAHYGLVLNYKSVTLEYFKSAITKEFDTGVNHRWGGLRLAF